MLLNCSITTQFTVVFVVALLVVGSFYLVLDSVYRSELESPTETVADDVDAFGSGVSQYGRILVKDDSRGFPGGGHADGSRDGGRGQRGAAGSVALLLQESCAGAVGVLRGGGEIGVASKVPDDVSQTSSTRSTSRTPSKRAPAHRLVLAGCRERHRSAARRASRCRLLFLFSLCW
jgi:hypothetical protein